MSRAWMFLWVSVLAAIFLLSALSFGKSSSPNVENQDSIKNYLASKKYADNAEDLIKKGKNAAARAEIDKCLAQSEIQDKARFLLAQILYNEGDIAGALSEITRAESDFQQIQKILTWENTDTIRKIEAEKERLEDVIENLKGEAEKAVCRRDDLLYQAKGLEEKISALNSELISLASRGIRMPADYLYFHGNCCFKLMNYAEAEMRYKMALESDPKHASSYNNLINLYFVTGRKEKALDALKMAEENHAAVNPALKEAVRKSTTS